MEPIIQDVVQEKGLLQFTLSGVNVSFANAIRRTILSDIPLVVFRTFPHNENKCTIVRNNTKLNNEIIKHRLSCIPIHIDNPLDFNLDMYVMELDVQNDKDEIILVTSKDFKIKDIVTNKYLPDSERDKIFPCDPITQGYIELVRLKPLSSHDNNGEAIQLSSEFSVGTAGENSCWNVVSTSIFQNTPDMDSIETQWAKREKELDSRLSPLEKNKIKTDFMNLDAQRYFLPNSFDFKIETIGVYTNYKLVELSTDILIKKCKKFYQSLEVNPELIQERFCRIPFSYQIELENEDYTFGKVIENMMYLNLFENEKKLTFISFKKEHPLQKNSHLLFSCAEDLEKEVIVKMIVEQTQQCIVCFQKIMDEFKDK